MRPRPISVGRGPANLDITWHTDNTFSMGDTHFKALPMGLGEHTSTLDQFVFQKPREMIDRYQALAAELSPRHIFELGIWKGGSCVFLQLLSAAERVVSVDLSEERIQALDEYRELRQLQDTLRPHYGVDQSDQATLAAILQQEFQGSPLDMVIDDASHFLDETRASFDVLFPALRPGGKYVIEDWSWAHGSTEFPDDEPAFYPEREALTKIVFELVLACGSNPDIVAGVEIDHHLVVVTRGERIIDPADFKLTDCCLARGRALITREAH